MTNKVIAPCFPKEGKCKRYINFIKHYFKNKVEKCNTPERNYYIILVLSQYYKTDNIINNIILKLKIVIDHNNYCNFFTLNFLLYNRIMSKFQLEFNLKLLDHADPLFVRHTDVRSAQEHCNPGCPYTNTTI